MAAGWLLLSLLYCVFEHAAPVAVPSGKPAASQIAETSSTPYPALQFHRLHLPEGTLGLSKSGSLGPFAPSCSPSQTILWLGNLHLASAPIGLASAWQFSLRAALNPRAPCLA
jgi:hypothetical protein